MLYQVGIVCYKEQRLLPLKIYSIIRAKSAPVSSSERRKAEINNVPSKMHPLAFCVEKGLPLLTDFAKQ